MTVTQGKWPSPCLQDHVHCYVQCVKPQWFDNENGFLHPKGHYNRGGVVGYTSSIDRLCTIMAPNDNQHRTPPTLGNHCFSLFFPIGSVIVFGNVGEVQNWLSLRATIVQNTRIIQITPPTSPLQDRFIDMFNAWNINDSIKASKPMIWSMICQWKRVFVGAGWSDIHHELTGYVQLWPQIIINIVPRPHCIFHCPAHCFAFPMY